MINYSSMYGFSSSVITNSDSAYWFDYIFSIRNNECEILNSVQLGNLVKLNTNILSMMYTSTTYYSFRSSSEFTNLELLMNFMIFFWFMFLA